MKISCNKKCKFYSQDGWIERIICIHPKFTLGKIIFSFKGDTPKWCPRLKLKGDKIKK
jgi:hypothetical protein